MSNDVGDSIAHPSVHTIVLTSQGPSEQPTNPFKDIETYLEKYFSDHGLKGSEMERMFNSMRRETDPELYLEALFHFATRLEAKDHLEPAAAIYSFLLQDDPEKNPIPDGLKGQAQKRMDAFRGKASVGNKWEFFGKQVLQETLKPSQFIPMMGSMVIGELAFGATWSRFSRSIYTINAPKIPGVVAFSKNLPPDAYLGFINHVGPHAANKVARVLGYGVGTASFPILAAGVETFQGRSPGEALDSSLHSGVISYFLVSSFFYLGKISAQGLRGSSNHWFYKIQDRVLPQLMAFGGATLNKPLGFQDTEDGRLGMLANSLGWLIHYNTARFATPLIMGRRHKNWVQASDNRAAGRYISDRGYFIRLGPS